MALSVFRDGYRSPRSGGEWDLSNHRLLYGELAEEKTTLGGQKKQFKENPKDSLKCIDITSDAREDPLPKTDSLDAVLSAEVHVGLHSTSRAESRAGLHNNVPDPPSPRLRPVGCQPAIMALTIKTVYIQKGGLHGRSCHPIWDVSASGLGCTRLVDVLPPWQ